MSAIGLYNKIQELENKIKTLCTTGVSTNTIIETPMNVEIPPEFTNKLNSLELNLVQSSSSLSDKIDNCYKRIDEVNNNLTSLNSFTTDKIVSLESRPIVPDVSDRLSLIEAKPTPPDLSVRVAAIEARLTELNAINDIYDKLNMMNDVINNLKQAFIALDDKIEKIVVMQSTPPS